LLLDSDSNRLLAKYYQPLHSDPKQPTTPTHYSTLKEQRAFETGLYEKTRKLNGTSPILSLSLLPTLTNQKESTGDILLYDNHLVLYKSSLDLTFYLVAPQLENEIMLQSVLSAFYDAVAMLLRHQVEKRSILENLDLVVLALDETIDNG